MKLKIICLNIWQGGNLMDNVIKFLNKENADFILLQEVYNSKKKDYPRNFRTLQVLEKNLNNKYYQHFSPAFLEIKSFGKIKQGNAILSKYPLKSDETIFFDIPFGKRIEEPKYFPVTPRNLEHVKTNVKGKTIHLFNTQGIWGRDGLDNPRRIKMGEKIASEVKKYKNVILAGDFNVQENTKTTDVIEKHLKNVFKNKLKTSFNMKHKTKGGYASAVVDMIFVSKHIKITAKKCSKANVSDHLALIVEINIL